jgi:hypothetical protein
VHPRALLRATRREYRFAREIGIGRSYFRGRVAGVLGLPAQLRRRREIQATRVVDLEALTAFLDRQEDLPDPTLSCGQRPSP